MSTEKKLPERSNTIRVIVPYWYSGTWVFDDPEVGLIREPFVSGVPEIIDRLVKDLPDARNGFRLLFSEQPFPGYQAGFEKLDPEYGGVWYRDQRDSRGWLCAALFKYFAEAPRRLYVRAEPLHRET